MNLSVAISRTIVMRHALHMLTLTRCVLLVLMVLLSVATARISAAQIAPRSKPPALHSYDVTAIQAILSDPGHYTFRIVRIRGVVQSLRQVPRRTICRSGISYGYEIRVKDESGELTVMDLGPCGRNTGSRGPVLPEMLASGDQIDALIVVSFTSHPWESPNPPEGLLNWMERTH
ncbi:MAG: hypothetical protein JSR29_09095 [Nitrospira sp.]|nr:hypothetical protein [Nitrospira sp.]